MKTIVLPKSKLGAQGPDALREEHPASIQLLARLGLADSLMHWGRRISRMALYEGEARQAELNFASLPGQARNRRPLRRFDFPPFDSCYELEVWTTEFSFRVHV